MTQLAVLASHDLVSVFHVKFVAHLQILYLPLQALPAPPVWLVPVQERVKPYLVQNSCSYSSLDLKQAHLLPKGHLTPVPPEQLVSV